MIMRSLKMIMGEENDDKDDVCEEGEGDDIRTGVSYRAKLKQM